MTNRADAAAPDTGKTPTPRPMIRLDKWLWQARFFKSRSLATGAVQAGHVRVNGQRVTKAAQSVGPGDVLTFAQGERVRVVRLTGIGARRGPAGEAQALYDDLTPVVLSGAEPSTPRPAPAFDGNRHDAGRRGERPIKKDRRSYDLSRRPPLE